MSQPPPQKISINIEICQPSEGGLSSIQKGMDIGGEPHKLAYINSDESSLLKAIGGQGEPMEGTNGIPAYAPRAMDVYLEKRAQKTQDDDPEDIGTFINPYEQAMINRIYLGDPEILKRFRLLKDGADSEEEEVVATA